MKIEKIYNFLNTISPFDTQEKWDNSGLIVGSFNDKVGHIYISLDLDLNMIKKIKPNSLIITHHPLIFSPLKKINNDSYSTKILKKLIKKDISLISMHTNIDKSHLNMYVGKEILGFNFEKKDDFVVSANLDISLKELKRILKDRLNIQHPKVVKSANHIKSISMTTGAGASLLSNIKTDCFITGDIKYHEAMEAKARGITLIDIGHYESEIHFTTLMQNLTKEYFKINNIKVKILKSPNPFSY